MSTKNKIEQEQTKETALVTRVQKVITVVNAVSEVFDVTNVQDIHSITEYCHQMDFVRDKTLLPECKLIQRVKDGVLWKGVYKSFEDFALRERGLKKVNAYNYAKVGTLVTENGFHSVFYIEGSKARDFEYTQLLTIIDSKLDIEKIKELIADYKITPSMKISELKKVLNTFSGKNITDEVETEIKSEPTETTESEPTETTESEPTDSEKTKRYNTMKAILNRYKDNDEFYEILIKFDEKETKKQ